MKIKLFEVRDIDTFIVISAIKTDSFNESEAFLLKRSGFNPGGNIIVTNMNTFASNYHSDKWNDKTMQTVHAFLEEKFDELGHGIVLDAEYIRGEAPKPKRSEKHLLPYHQIGMTLSEFGQCMKEVGESQQFFAKFDKVSYSSDKDMVYDLFLFRSNIDWITSVVNGRGTTRYTPQQIFDFIDLSRREKTIKSQILPLVELLDKTQHTKGGVGQLKEFQEYTSDLNLITDAYNIRMNRHLRQVEVKALLENI